MLERKRSKQLIAKSVLKGSLTVTAWALAVLFEAGALTVQAFLSPSLYSDFPNAGLIFFDDKPSPKKKKLKYKEITIRQSLRRLEKMGFVTKKESAYVLTAKGRELVSYVLQRKKIKQKKWDKKYRVVIFDIPENKKDVRNWLRDELYFLEYKKLQNSVFIGKYALPDDVVREIKKQNVSNCVNYLLVDKVFKNVF